MSKITLSRDIWFTRDMDRDPDISKGKRLKVVARMINGVEIMVKHNGKTFTLPREWVEEDKK